ncbi:hypothetical protein B5807_00560 [Epicoccum nigrum]|uniref:Uncharacterized protein n=1 Tax=Epicoccum nigrum TaxID=105696 RepID=A0A1Y2MDZ0_EPING|nr:hypothetical protein B5807_00560 [Epicoccum nigrum]
MTHRAEDEVDWSDGTIDDPPDASNPRSGDSGYNSVPSLRDPPYSSTPHSGDSDNSSSPHREGGLSLFVEPHESDEYTVPNGTPLSSAVSIPSTTRVQRARIGVHLNRRRPSTQDYRHFALYQANQKAYEATFLKEFVKHAFAPSQLKKCVEYGAAVHPNVLKYISSVSTAIGAITNKMTWNAHSRVVNLLTNAGQDSAPFWDVTSLDRSIFGEFDLDKPSLVARRMDASWHRSDSSPSMVTYASKDYPVSQYGSVIEDIDDVSSTLFDKKAYGSSLPAGRPIKHPVSSSKRKGLLGARTREPVDSVHRKNWLAPLLQPVSGEPHKQDHRAAAASTADDYLPTAKPKMRSDLRYLHDEGQHDTSAEVAQTTAQAVSSGSTKLEQLFEDFGCDMLNGQEHMSSDLLQQQVSWPKWLLTNHKRRLTRSSPQMLERALPSIRAALIEATLQGCRPVGHNFEQLVADIEGQERAEAARLNIDRQANHRKKRRRNPLPPIRMFNQPIDTSKKRRRLNRMNASSAATGLAQQYASDDDTTNQEPLQPHPSGSKTLEVHQKLPSNAYFHAKSPDEKLVWRCSIKHPMGYYYNAGNRKNCAGCFNAFSETPKAKIMDFYLPSRTFFYQPEPNGSVPWRPSKPFGRLGRARRSVSSHNSIAKDAYWAAIDSGADAATAFVTAKDAVTQHLASKVKKEPSPQPTPEPEPDLGLHPSGSKTMEHGQDLPITATFTCPSHRHAEFAWRCDVNHALGRYYLAGDRRCCPGCGSNKTGPGKRMTMDFYLPKGVFVRQKVDGTKWTPKKPYKTREGKEKKVDKEKQFHTHNQYASRMYWKAVDNGLTTDAALVSAIDETDKWVDAREEDAELKAELRKDLEEKKSVRRAAAKTTKAEGKKPRAKKAVGKSAVKGLKKTSQDLTAPTSSMALNALRARAASSEESEVDTDDDEYSDEGESQADEDMGAGDPAEVLQTSSNDESSSSSEEE